MCVQKIENKIDYMSFKFTLLIKNNNNEQNTTSWKLLLPKCESFQFVKKLLTIL